MTREEAKALRAAYRAKAEADAEAQRAAHQTRVEAAARAKAQAKAALRAWEWSVRQFGQRHVHREQGHVGHRAHAWHRTVTPPPPQTDAPPRTGPSGARAPRWMALAVLALAAAGG